MKTKFKKGDKVRIRQWEDMEKEFGLDDDGDIDCHYSFTKEMKNLCGLTATVDYITKNGIFLTNWENNHQHFYFFNDCMLEPVIDKVDPDLITFVRTKDKIVATYKTKEVSISEQNFVKVSKLTFEELIKHFEEIDDLKVYTHKKLDEKLNVKEEYKEVKRPAKKGDYIKLIEKSFSFTEVGDILKVTSVDKDGLVRVLGKDHPRDTEDSPVRLWSYDINEYVVLENYQPKEKPQKVEFKPYLKDTWSNSHFGNIGEETNQTDVFEEKLYVGDGVELYSVKTKTLFGEHIVVCTENKYGVMGIHQLDFKNGISDHWRIKKVKSYKGLKHNEKIDDIIAILKEE